MNAAVLGPRTAPATQRFLQHAERLRSVISPNKKGIRRPERQNRDLARGCANSKVAGRAEVSLRTEQVVSFADVCHAKQ